MKIRRRYRERDSIPESTLSETLGGGVDDCVCMTIAPCCNAQQMMEHDVTLSGMEYQPMLFQPESWRVAMVHKQPTATPTEVAGAYGSPPPSGTAIGGGTPIEADLLLPEPDVDETTPVPGAVGGAPP